MNDVLAHARVLLAATPQRWLALAETTPHDLLARQPLPGEWSALECLQHVVDTEPIFVVRIEAILAGRAFPGFDPDAQKKTPGDALAVAQEFARLRSDTLATLAKVTPADLERRGHHQELGSVTLSEHLNEVVAHDLMHVVQAERALMQPFIQASGPWQPYFADHVARKQQ